MGALYCRRTFLRPSKPRLAKDGDSGCAVNRLDDSDQLGWPESSAVLEKSRRKVCDPERSRRSLKRRLEDIGIGKIPLRARFATGRTNAETSAIVFVEK